MPLDITISLNDADLEKFQESIDKGRLAIADAGNIQRLEEAATELIGKARDVQLPRHYSAPLQDIHVATFA